MNFFKDSGSVLNGAPSGHKVHYVGGRTPLLPVPGSARVGSAEPFEIQPSV